MRYLTIDASLSGTGIRNQYEGGYITPEELNLNDEIIHLLKDWLSEYEEEHYNGYENNQRIDELDKKGKKIALMIKNSLSEVKVEYFSDARMVKEII